MQSPFDNEEKVVQDVKSYMNYDSIFTKRQRLKSAGRIKRDCNLTLGNLDWNKHIKGSLFHETPPVSGTLNESEMVSRRTNDRFDHNLSSNHIVSKRR